MICIDNVTKIYNSRRGQVVANKNISLTIKEGEIVGLLGHNGAGKTTLVNQLLGLLKPTEGAISILGESITDFPERGRYLCSVQPQSQLSLGEMTPTKAVHIMGALRGGSPEDVRRETKRLFKELDIEEWANKDSMRLSGGIKRLTAFCMAVICSRQIIILDEPTNDVDPIRRRYMWRVIRNLTKQGKGVIVITHNVAEIESVVDRVVILHHGQCIVDSTVQELRGDSHDQLSLAMLPTDLFQVQQLPVWAGEGVRKDERYVVAVPLQQVSEALEWARQQKKEGRLYEYTISELTLEDIYVRVTADGNEV